MAALRLSRRQLLKAGAATMALGCTGGGDGDVAATPDTAPDTSPPPDEGSLPESPEVPPEDIAAPEPISPTLLAPEYWHTCVAYVRHDAASGVGTRFNFFNPAAVPMTLNFHLLHQDGTVAIEQHGWRTLAPSASTHPTLGSLLADAGIEGAFEGHLWIGAKPESGPTFMGLQGFSSDWLGPGAHVASVHAMRDFGNSNHDLIWTDMVLPRVVSGERFETVVGIANASGVGGDLPTDARPTLVVGSDEGEELGRLDLDAIPAFGSRRVAISEIVGDLVVPNGTIRLSEPEVRLVAVAFVHDKVHGGFTNADHFFDRNFVDCVPLGAVNACSTTLEPF